MFKLLDDGCIPRDGDEEYRWFKWRPFKWYGDIVILNGRPIVRRKISEPVEGQKPTTNSRYATAMDVFDEFCGKPDYYSVYNMPFRNYLNQRLNPAEEAQDSA